MAFYFDSFGFYPMSGNAGLPSDPNKNIYVAQWDNLFSYDLDSVVAYNGLFYKSIGSGNIGNLPTDPLYWETVYDGVIPPYKADFLIADWTPDGGGGFYIDIPSATHQQGIDKFVYAFISSTDSLTENSPFAYGDFTQYSNGDIRILSDMTFDGYLLITSFANGGGSTTSSDYNTLTSKPILNTSNTTTQSTDVAEIIQGTINLHKVSKTGDYNDLLNPPPIPTLTSELTNDSGFITSSSVPTVFSTSKYYVDGTLGDDLTADGSVSKPFKTIQACLNFVGQPISMQDAMRHIAIYISDALTAIVGNNSGANQSWDGVYKENLVVPSRMITMYGAGIKIGNNVYNVDTGFGNILKEYSSSRRFGASSSDLRPCLTFVGLMNCRDTHNRLRNGFHIGGTCRTSILKRNFDSIQGNGSNTVTVHITSGQNPYVISVNPNYPTEPLIRISISGTTYYNGTYDITTKVDDTTFIATKTSGTNTHTEVEVSGSFFESDSAGASGVTHDSAFVNCYMQGQYTCDDGTVNSAAPTAGTEVLYSVNSRWFTGIEGRTILAQRWEDTTLAGTNIISSIAGMFNCSFSGSLQLASFTYSTDDMGLMDCRFNSATPITLTGAGQTVRMDSVTYSSFLSSGSTWITNTPTIALLDNAKANGYTPSISGNWVSPVPTTVQNALDRMSTLLKTLNGGNAIP